MQTYKKLPTGSELKPCPFCGEKDDVIYYNGCVFCDACGASGPGHKARGFAVDAWNKRPFEAEDRPEEK